MIFSKISIFTIIMWLLLFYANEHAYAAGALGGLRSEVSEANET